MGRTQHSAPVEDGAVGRKGISVERTFAALSTPADLEAKVITIPCDSLLTLTARIIKRMAPGCRHCCHFFFQSQGLGIKQDSIEI